MELYNRIFTVGAIMVILALAAGLALMTPGCNENLQNDPQFTAFLADPNMAVGKAVFEKNCISCHPYGKAGMGPNLSKKKLTAEIVKRQVRKGGLIMPSFAETKISSESLEQLAIFVPALNPDN